MSVYVRYKRPGGLRALVELLEGAAPQSRQKMIERGMVEDEQFTRVAQELIMVWEDVLKLNDAELCEITNKAHPRAIGIAISNLEEEVKKRFLKTAPMKAVGEIREFMEQKFGPREISGARIKLVQSLRELEKIGILHIKKIPEMIEPT